MKRFLLPFQNMVPSFAKATDGRSEPICFSARGGSASGMTGSSAVLL